MHMIITCTLYNNDCPTKQLDTGPCESTTLLHGVSDLSRAVNALLRGISALSWAVYALSGATTALSHRISAQW